MVVSSLPSSIVECSSQESSFAPCPVCGVSLARSIIQQHVEVCLESGGGQQNHSGRPDAVEETADAAPSSVRSEFLINPQPSSGHPVASPAAAADNAPFQQPCSMQQAGQSAQIDTHPAHVVQVSQTVAAWPVQGSSTASQPQTQSQARQGARLQRSRQARLDGGAVLKPLPARSAKGPVARSAGQPSQAATQDAQSPGLIRQHSRDGGREGAGDISGGDGAARPPAGKTGGANAFAAMMTAQRELSQVLATPSMHDSPYPVLLTLSSRLNNSETTQFQWTGSSLCCAYCLLVQNPR